LLLLVVVEAAKDMQAVAVEVAFALSPPKHECREPRTQLQSAQVAQDQHLELQMVLMEVHQYLTQILLPEAAVAAQ
jgi:hypothetical protein